MNIQIFGTKKNADVRKAERFFKERGIKFQSIDLKEKGLSKGEFNSVMQAVGGVDAMIDPECKDKDLLALVTYISADERAEKVMKNQSVMIHPHDQEHFHAGVTVTVSPQFFGWLADIGKGIRISWPEDVREAYKQYLQGIVDSL